MSAAVISAVSGLLVAAVGVFFGSAWLNRHNLAKLTQAQASLTQAQATGERADAAETITGTALLLVQQLQQRNGYLEQALRVAQRRLDIARAYIEMLVQAMRLDGIPVPAPPPDILEGEADELR